MKFHNQRVYVTSLLLTFSLSLPFLCVLSNNVEDPVGNHIATYFRNCHAHIIDFSAQAPFNFQRSDTPRTLYTYSATSLNYSIYLNISDHGIGRNMRILNGVEKIQRFKCILNMVSVPQRTVGTKRYFGVTLGSILTRKSVFSSGTLMQVMPEFVVVFGILDKNLGSEDRQSFENFTQRLINNFL